VFLEECSFSESSFVRSVGKKKEGSEPAREEREAHSLTCAWAGAFIVEEKSVQSFTRSFSILDLASCRDRDEACAAKGAGWLSLVNE